MKKRTLIFGASLGGQRLLNVLSRQEQVVAFIDNDPAKHGKKLKGHPILPPTEALALEHDQLIIASQSFAEIGPQLEKLGADPSKIVVADGSILRGEFELGNNKFGCAFIALGAIAIAIIILSIAL